MAVWQREDGREAAQVEAYVSTRTDPGPSCSDAPEGDPNFYTRLQRNKDTLRPPGERAAPTRELEKLIVSKKLAHGGNPVTRWMAANVAVTQDPAGNLKPAKDKSTERIDGIVATIMAIGRAMVAQEEPQPAYSMFFV